VRRAIERAQHVERHRELVVMSTTRLRSIATLFYLVATPKTMVTAAIILLALRHFSVWQAGHTSQRLHAKPPCLEPRLVPCNLCGRTPAVSKFDLRTRHADSHPQETLRRVPTSSRPVAPSATPSRRTVATRLALPCTASSAARPVPSTATPTPTPTSRRASPGTTTPSSPTSRTPRSTSLVPRWPSVVSRRRRTGTT
jgi:hypothetical protein